MTLNVENFKGKLATGGARSNLFEVEITDFGMTESDSKYMARASSFPASTVEAVEVPFRGRIIKVAGDRSFENWSVTFFNEQDFRIRTLFEQWMNDNLNAHVENTGVNTPATYKKDMHVYQLDEQGARLRGYKFVGAFPVSVGTIELSFDQQSAIEEFEVEFAYDYWEIAN